jgi:hypothetical protein
MDLKPVNKTLASQVAKALKFAFTFDFDSNPGDKE